MDITIYSKTQCPFCTFAKKWFNSNNIEFKEINLDDDNARLEFYKNYSCRTVPQIFINNERIGGYEDLMAKKNDILAKKVTFTSTDF